MRKRAADRLQRQADHAADFLARQAQLQFRCGESARTEALGHFEQEGGHPPLGTQAAHAQHQVAVAADFGAERAVKLAHQIGIALSVCDHGFVRNRQYVA